MVRLLGAHLYIFTGIDFLLLVKSYGDLSVFNPPSPLCFAFIPILTCSSFLGSLCPLYFSGDFILAE